MLMLTSVCRNAVDYFGTINTQCIISLIEILTNKKLLRKPVFIALQITDVFEDRT